MVPEHQAGMYSDQIRPAATTATATTAAAAAAAATAKHHASPSLRCTMQPYYHMLADGRFSAMKSLFGFYGDMLPVSKARTQQWFNISGTFFPETKQQTGENDEKAEKEQGPAAAAAAAAVRHNISFRGEYFCLKNLPRQAWVFSERKRTRCWCWTGLYDSGGLGWGCKSASPTVPTPGNSYIRYHREGGLEIGRTTHAETTKRLLDFNRSSATTALGLRPRTYSPIELWWH